MQPLKNAVSFVTMVILVFIGTSVPSLLGGVSSGPNFEIDVGLYGWMRLHRHATRWTVEAVDARFLIADICVAILLTWGLSNVLKRRKHDSKTA
jgi:hypothetical protein